MVKQSRLYIYSLLTLKIRPANNVLPNLTYFQISKYQQKNLLEQSSMQL
jgi:hypothetical protein